MLPGLVHIPPKMYSGPLVAEWLSPIGYTSASSVTQYTFSWNIGPARPDLWIVVGTNASSSQDVSSVSVGGVAATRIGGPSGNTTNITFWLAKVPQGGTVNVVINLNSSKAELAAWIFRVTGAHTIEVVDDAASPSAADPEETLSINVVAGGAVIGGYRTIVQDDNHVWSNIPRVFNEDPAPVFAITVSGAIQHYAANANGVSISCNGGGLGRMTLVSLKAGRPV